VRVDTSGVTFSIDPGHIRPGEHVYITTTTGALTSVGIAIAGGPPSAACATAP
jgi:hypothetical protein